MYYPVYSRRMRCISNRLARSLASHPAAIEDVNGPHINISAINKQVLGTRLRNNTISPV